MILGRFCDNPLNEAAQARLAPTRIYLARSRSRVPGRALTWAFELVAEEGPHVVILYRLQQVTHGLEVRLP